MNSSAELVTRQSKVSSWEGQKDRRVLDCQLNLSVHSRAHFCFWLPLTHDLLGKINLFTPPNQRNVRSTLRGLARVHLWRLNNEDDNNDDIFCVLSRCFWEKMHSFFFVVPCVLRLRRSLRGTTTKTKTKKLHYVNLNEPRLTDQRASGVLVQTMFIKDIWDNLWHRSLEGTRSHNRSTDGRWKIWLRNSGVLENNSLTPFFIVHTITLISMETKQTEKQHVRHSHHFFALPLLTCL